MINSSKMMSFSIMIMSTLLALSSESWLGIWMGMEMNMIAFIPILYMTKNSQSSESCMIYFLTQSLGSILMLIAVLSNILIMVFPDMIKMLFYTLLTLSMMIKLGVPPFHFWFPEIMNKMNWINCIILMTWQKVAPLCVMSYIIEMTPLTTIMIMTSVIMGSLGGLNQTSIRKIMAFSSINHMGWMIACMKFNSSWMEYLIIYSIMISMISMTLLYYSAYFINQIHSMSKSMSEKLMIIIMFLSLGGLPPFLGFLPKWMVIQAMIISKSYSIMIIMILTVLITLFFYLRMTSPTMMLNNNTNKWNSEKTINMKLTKMILLLNCSIPVISTFSF
uniref:NADH-ubiquinone oxidoreductase chain 2 n=1 Tax=Valentia hoffmanni TaxID=575843 RepID=C5HIX8_9HEMI|nr:NADH dehydrogenase subunit 2 [Valentia hoffmanni]ACJ69573.1 NADH dehydrogenase subunit 2 [Valentia hoffmanni]